MAHAEKFTKGAVFGIANHIERKTENHSNEDIDSSKTKDNYSLLNDESDLITRLNNRLDEVHVYNRKDVNVMINWVVTLPEELKEATEEDKRAFFSNTHEFLVKRYGGLKNVVSSEVHVDETTPHLHFSFIPVVFDEKRQQERVQANKVVDRKELMVFHDDLHDYLKKEIPGIYQKGVLNDKTIQASGVPEIKKMNKEIDKQKEIRKKTLAEVTAYKKPLEELNGIVRNAKRSMLGQIQLSDDELTKIENLVLSTEKISGIHTKFKNSAEQEIKLLNNKIYKLNNLNVNLSNELSSVKKDNNQLDRENYSLNGRLESKDLDLSMLEVLTSTDLLRDMSKMTEPEYQSLYILGAMRNKTFKPTKSNLEKAELNFSRVSKDSRIFDTVNRALNYVREKLNEITKKVKRSNVR